MVLTKITKITKPNTELNTFKQTSIPIVAPMFRERSVFNGDMPFITFNVGDKVVGALWGTDGKLSFEGDSEASAELFFDHVIELNRARS